MSFQRRNKHRSIPDCETHLITHSFIMKTSPIYLAALALLLAACGGKQAEASKETAPEKTAPAVQPAAPTMLPGETEEEISEPDDVESVVADDLSNKQLLIGHWFIPHSATVYIDFTADGRFVFQDYNEKTQAEETLSGTYSLSKGVLQLQYDDRTGQKFTFSRGKDGDDNYYITKGRDYYFVKGDGE